MTPARPPNAAQPRGDRSDRPQPRGCAARRARQARHRPCAGTRRLAASAHGARLARGTTSLRSPFVVKPRFGSWGRDVERVQSEADLAAQLTRLRERGWFRRQGALVQELVSSEGRDLRLVIAAGRVVGAVERVARPGEWRTNVSLGAERWPVSPPLAAHRLALRAAPRLRVTSSASTSSPPATAPGS